MDNLDFSEEEIRQQLSLLGYKNIPRHKLHEFKRDLDALISERQWTSPSTSGEKPQPSPPAYTKEKIRRSDYEESGGAFYLHQEKGDHKKQHLLGTHEIRVSGREHERPDSYAQHSVAPRLHYSLEAPGRLQAEPRTLTGESAGLSDSCSSHSDLQPRRFIKRKVLRKHQGQTLVCDESIYSEDSDAASCLEGRLSSLRLSEGDDSDLTSEQSDSPSSGSDRVSLDAFQSDVRTLTRSHSDGDLRSKPKSFIRPTRSQFAVKKSDPVARYFQYKQFWKMFQVPGERDRRALRWEVKERLAHHVPPPKPRRVYMPNSYVVPTLKKRSALRWEIRTDLANGILPHKFSYQP